MSAPLRAHWGLDPKVVFLNHGSFGACPTAVLQHQSELRARLEAEPVRFLGREVEPLLDEARAALAAFVGADADDLAFMPNATTGVNTVLRNLRFEPGDELLTTDNEYNASKNALDVACAAMGAKVVVAKLPWPVTSPDAVVDAVMALVTPRTRLLLIDHITSQTALVMPLAELVRRMRERGVETLVDGAHGPGMVPLALQELGAAYYTGNCHKWLCAPKGAAFLYVRRDMQAGMKPLVVSHGHNSPRADRSRFRLEFDWTGTHDPTPFLCIPTALRVVGGLVPGGWPEVMASNREKALAARRSLNARLGQDTPLCPDAMVGSMACVALPEGAPERPEPPLYLDPLHVRLFEEHRVEVPVTAWPKAPRRHLRVSAQLYNTPADYEALGDALEALLR
ncbi:aminotransferase class V-fold PLP-dependent enzyme [Corallococcus praedator]|uniref:Aminotransferase class V-fold PLP-dependent enzyme n=1 Tax=Corallococcus praedator TaxID=2316724 RepID=A0ABX9QBN2_9BACT|nr:MULTISPECIES: aminotransferase class V-fold PLP-dependent enzyme [Corallococcus]RKH23528.1 aminotransferase class V-fold PLP-dependent enzyme [Corallococcus sp. CA031C]RKH99019.1 aminotransferase class V-fold PLP-dependent enzyme [Corallococcus praedator]